MEHINRKFCNSCGKEVLVIRDSVVFKCPNCGEEIARCGLCRKKGVKYTCKICGFVGP